MAIVFMTDPVTGHCALYDEPAGGGAFDDLNAPRNAPLRNPTAYLANIYFHSALDNMEVHSDTTVSVNHAGVGAGSDTTFVTFANQVYWNSYVFARAIVWHGLGYVPDYFVAQGSNVLWPGMPVQSHGDGRGRYVTAYADENYIYLHEWVSASSTALSAVSLNYRVLIFKAPPAPVGNVLFDADGNTGRVLMGRGRFDSFRQYLQVVPGGTPFGIFYGKSIDVKNGAPCFARPDGTTFKPVSTDMRGRIRPPNDSSPGASMGYDGSFVGSEAIPVQAP
jgi:hypothetical protein